MLTIELILMMLPPAEPNRFTASWEAKISAKHIQVVLFVEVLFGDLFERCKLVDAGVVHQDVEPVQTPLSPQRTAVQCRLFSTGSPARRRPCHPCS